MSDQIKSASLVSIGNEVLSGRTIDTNAAHIGQQLRLISVPVVSTYTVGDRREAIVRVLALAASEADIVVVTGGLGPTEDDRTRQAACRAFDRVPVTDDSAKKRLEGFWKDRGLSMPGGNIRQALFPEGAEIWINPAGTADGFRCASDRGEAVFLPGVPRELRAMTGMHVLPWLSSKNPDAHAASRTVRLFGLPESEVDAMLSGWPPADSGVLLVFGASFPEIKLTLSAGGASAG